MSPTYYFHCIPDRTDFLPVAPRPIKILISAYRVKMFRAITRSLAYADEIFLDSGMISAWKKKHLHWMASQPYLIKLAWEIKAHRTAMLDIPMEPNMLDGFPPKEAMKTTYLNAEAFIDAEVPGTKVFVVQGYEPQQYLECIRQYRKIGIFDLPDIWIAIGSVCMRRPKGGLYDIARLVRDNIPEDLHLHAFGIGQIAWINKLIQIGVNSFDSSTASIRTAFNKGRNRIERKRINADLPGQFAQDMIDYESEINSPDQQLTLF